MSRPSKSGGIVVDLLIAVAISLVVNFSYLLVLVVEKSDDRRPPFSREQEADRESVRVEGDVWVSPDGHGYLLYDAPKSLSDDDSVRTGLEEAAPVREQRLHSLVIRRVSCGCSRATGWWPTRSNRGARAGIRCWGWCWNATVSRSITGCCSTARRRGRSLRCSSSIFSWLAFLLLSLLRLGDGKRPVPGVSETRPALHGARRGALLHRARGAVADA